MSPSEAHQAILARFFATWGSSPRVVLAGEVLTPSPGSLETWARLNIQDVGRAQETMGARGGRRFRTPGYVYVSVFTPLNRGTTTGRDLAKAAADVFEGEAVSGVTFYEGQVSDLGVDRDGPWYHHQARVRFEYEERK